MQNRMSVAFLSQTTSETSMAGSELVCGIQSRRDEVMAKESFCGDFGGFRIGLNQRTSMGCLYPHGSAGTASGQGLSPFPSWPTIRPAPLIGVAVSQRAQGAIESNCTTALFGRIQPLSGSYSFEPSICGPTRWANVALPDSTPCFPQPCTHSGH